MEFLRQALVFRSWSLPHYIILVNTIHLDPDSPDVHLATYCTGFKALAAVEEPMNTGPVSNGIRRLPSSSVRWLNPGVCVWGIRGVSMPHSQVESVNYIATMCSKARYGNEIWATIRSVVGASSGWMGYTLCETAKYKRLLSGFLSRHVSGSAARVICPILWSSW